MDKNNSSLPELPVWAKYVTKEDLPIDLYIIADIIGLDNVIRLMEHFDCMTFSVPRNASYKFKKQYILDNYDGTKKSKLEIIKTCKVSASYIYSVMKEKTKK